MSEGNIVVVDDDDEGPSSDQGRGAAKRQKTGDGPIEKLLRKLYCCYIGEDVEEMILVLLKSMGSVQSGDLRQRTEAITGNFVCRWGSLSIDKRDMRILLSEEWLNDNIMNMFLCIITRSLGYQFLDGPEGRIPFPECIVVNTFLYKALFMPDGQVDSVKVARWFNHADISEVHRIAVPINLEDVHWIGVVIDTREHRLHICDSSAVPSRRTELHAGIAKRILSFYEALCRVKGRTTCTRSEWLIYYNSQCILQQQNDGNSCGVWVLFNLLFLMQGKEVVPIGNNNIPNARKWIAQKFLEFGEACAQESDGGQ